MLEVEHVETNSDVERSRSQTGNAPTMSSGTSAPPPKKTSWQSLAIFTGTNSDENLIPLLLAPIMVHVNLGALWMIVVTGLLSSFYVSQSFVAA